MGNYCEACFEKQRTIDKLQEEIRRLKEQLKDRKNIFVTFAEMRETAFQLLVFQKCISTPAR